ncbi:MAG TPA: phosphatase PAP2 family protein [Clostridiales bacterium]|nr:phosphatase PAP2 family protein [Clostridiales bacterium]HPZ05624.1 phosphatase PAP2 family protein [Clostridiales bacterium]HQD30932.1 phosphatase PAP2 family protein [Clostridiales bacterium]
MSMCLTEIMPASGLWNGIMSFDDAVYECVSGFISDGMTRFMKIVTFLGSEWAITFLALIIPALVFILRKKEYYRPGLLISANIAFGALFNQILKLIFRRPRPELFRLTEATGYSFPSGHAMNSVIFYGFIAYLLVRHGRHRSKYLFAGIIAAMVLLIGLSRIYLGVHYVSDVLAGFVLGAGWLIIAARISGRFLNG